MEALISIKSLSGQAVAKTKGGKGKADTQSLSAFGLMVQNTVNKGKQAPIDKTSSQVKGINIKALKQQLTEALASINEEKPPLSADDAGLKSVLEQLLKKLNGKNELNPSDLKSLNPIMKDLGEALETKKEETESGDPNGVWDQLLVTIQNMVLQGQGMNSGNKGQTPASEGGALKSVGQPSTSQTPSAEGETLKPSGQFMTTKETTAQMSSITAGVKLTDFSNRRLGSPLSLNKQPDPQVTSSVDKAVEKLDIESLSKTPKVTKAGASVQILPEKQKSDSSGAQTSTDIGNLLTGGRPMNKIQQMLFHQVNVTEQNPADQIANQIKLWISQGALKNAAGELSIRLNLHPDNLGAVQLAITQTDGGLTASITAHSGKTQDLINSQLNHLEQALTASGIPVYKIDVSLAQTPPGTSDSNYQPQQDQSQGRQSGEQQSTPHEQSSEGPEFETWLKEGLDE